MKALGPASDNLAEIETVIKERLSAATVQSGDIEHTNELPTDSSKDKKPYDSGKACEDLTAGSLATRVVSNEVMRADRSGFGAGASLHSSYDLVTRFETEIIVKERRIRVETVTDLHSGKSLRADLSSLGPERSRITWASLALLICLVIEAGMPFTRLQKALYSAFGIFSTGSICRHFQAAAKKLVYVYLWLVAELGAKALVLAGDDSHTRCIEMELNAARGLQNKG